MGSTPYRPDARRPHIRTHCAAFQTKAKTAKISAWKTVVYVPRERERERENKSLVLGPQIPASVHSSVPEPYVNQTSPWTYAGAFRPRIQFSLDRKIAV